MASYDTEEEKVIIDRFDAQWGSTTPVQYPNEGETTPSDNTEWVRLTILSDDGSLADVNPTNARHRFGGQVVVQVFTPRGTGSKRNSELCQKAVDAFNHFTSSGSNTALVFGTAFKRTVGSDGPWFQQNVVASYHRDSLIDIS